MNYIGSKLSLLPHIQSMIEEKNIDTSGVFCDIFSGTSIVAQMAKTMGFTVFSNDIQHYSFVMQKCFIESNGYPAFERLRKAEPSINAYQVSVSAQTLTVDERRVPRFGLATGSKKMFNDASHLARVLAFLEAQSPVKGPFSDIYCEAGSASRNYFSAANGAKCEAIRNLIEEHHNAGLLTEIEYYILIASLIESMDMVANTASVYGAYLKHVKKSAQASLTLKLPMILNGNRPHRAFRQDGNELIKRLALEGEHEVLYIDPPYNRRQYYSNYHILETIARWDVGAFEPVGKTGLRPADEQRSMYALSRQAEAAFADLIKSARFRHIIVSYSNEGIVPEDRLEEILIQKSPAGNREFRKIKYKRFRADNDSETRKYTGDEVEEFLFYVRCT